LFESLLLVAVPACDDDYVGRCRYGEMPEGLDEVNGEGLGCLGKSLDAGELFTVIDDRHPEPGHRSGPRNVLRYVAAPKNHQAGAARNGLENKLPPARCDALGLLSAVSFLHRLGQALNCIWTRRERVRQ